MSTGRSFPTLWKYLQENADYPYYLIKDRVTKAEVGQLAVYDGARVRFSRSIPSA